LPEARFSVIRGRILLSDQNHSVFSTLVLFFPLPFFSTTRLERILGGNSARAISYDLSWRSSRSSAEISSTWDGGCKREFQSVAQHHTALNLTTPKASFASRLRTRSSAPRTASPVD